MRTRWVRITKLGKSKCCEENFRKTFSGTSFLWSMVSSQSCSQVISTHLSPFSNLQLLLTVFFSEPQCFNLHLRDHWHVLLTELQQALYPSSFLFYCLCQLSPFALQNLDMKTGQSFQLNISLNNVGLHRQVYCLYSHIHLTHKYAGDLLPSFHNCHEAIKISVPSSWTGKQRKASQRLQDLYDCYFLFLAGNIKHGLPSL